MYVKARAEDGGREEGDSNLVSALTKSRSMSSSTTVAVNKIIKHRNTIFGSTCSRSRARA